MASAAAAAGAGLDILFDFAAVRTQRDVVRFAERYGPVADCPLTVLYWACWVCTALHGERLRQAGDAASERALPAPPGAPPTGTVLAVVLEGLSAVHIAQVRLALCPTDGRFFSPANPRARYCRPACAATAAKWRAEHHLTTPRPTRARTAVERLPVAEEPR